MKINQNNSKKELYAYEQFQGCWWYSHTCLPIPYFGGVCVGDSQNDGCNYCTCSN